MGRFFVLYGLGKKLKSKVSKYFLLTLIVIFVLQASMLFFIFSSYYRQSVKDISALGESNVKSQASMVETYLSKGGNVLWFAAESVEHLLKKGADSDELLEYLTAESDKMKEKFDANFTGIYGYLNGDYVDGSGWIPKEDYDPLSRSWYIEAMAAGGEVVLSKPYVDAQTGDVVVSYSQLLSDGVSVLSLDIILTEIRNYTENMSMSGVGYGFIVDDSGLVIAHSDRAETGKNYFEEPVWKDNLPQMIKSGDENYAITLDGKRWTVFTEPVNDSWHVVTVVENSVLFSELNRQLAMGIIVSLIIYLIIVVLSVFSVRGMTKAEKKEQESMERLKETNKNTINCLASAIDAKDRYTSGHSKRVADYALMIAKRMGKSEDEQAIIYNAGILHDVGKIRVPEDVINKPGKLTEEEFDSIRIHPGSGYHILHSMEDDVRIGYGAKYHHERYDGKGYPNGLAGETIPEVARIIAVADAYDAMASNRSYREALPQEKVRSEIERGRGSQFDPQIADIMLEIIDEDKEYRLRQRSEEYSRILVVDDEEIMLRDVENILKDMDNTTVILAQSEKEALSVIRDMDIDLIMLDLIMPDTDGFSLLEKLRQIREMPVIMMTGDRSEKTLEKIRMLKIDDYITKPLNAAITRETVQGILGRGR